MITGIREDTLTFVDLALKKDKTYKPSHSEHWGDTIHTVAAVHIPRTPGEAHFYTLAGLDGVYREHDLLKIDTRIRKIIRNNKRIPVVKVQKGKSSHVRKEERELAAVADKMAPTNQKRKHVPNPRYNE